MDSILLLALFMPAGPVEVIAMALDASQPLMSYYDPSHDLLNELMIVIGECDLLDEELLEYRHARRLHMIREAAVRMSQRVAQHQLLVDRNMH